MPILSDSRTGFFMFPYTLSDPDAWRGATLFTTYNDGDTWHAVDSIFDQTLHARIDDEPNVGPFTRWDRGNSLRITPINQKSDLLQSASELSVLNGSNSAIIGSVYEGWEIISFKDVDQNADGSFTLSCLIRGRRGTEKLVNTPKHLFILLYEPGMLYVPVRQDRIGETRFYRLVTNGMYLEDFMSKSFITDGTMFKPWNPVHIKGWRETNNDLKITWVRRSRGTEESWISSGTVPMLENKESYEIDIMDETTVKRTITAEGTDCGIAGVVYTSEQQSSDFGSAQSQITVNIYQMSEIVGRGFAGTATI